MNDADQHPAWHARFHPILAPATLATFPNTKSKHDNQTRPAARRAADGDHP